MEHRHQELSRNQSFILGPDAIVSYTNAQIIVSRCKNITEYKDAIYL